MLKNKIGNIGDIDNEEIDEIRMKVLDLISNTQYFENCCNLADLIAAKYNGDYYEKLINDIIL